MNKPQANNSGQTFFRWGTTLIALLALSSPAAAQSFSFSTGDPDGRIATASRPASAGKEEIESADDFVLTQETLIRQATFTGLLPAGSGLSDIAAVRVEIYRVFPKDSQAPPDGRVPTRVNSPSDVAFDSRDSSLNDVEEKLTFDIEILADNFTADNSVINGINPLPNQHTGGEGPVSGEEVLFEVTFPNAFDLPADHYFFVPQVQLNDGDFFWLSAPKPIIGGTPFTPDLQSWIRNADLDPDWLRIGTDIVGGTTFNATFSLHGNVAHRSTDR